MVAYDLSRVFGLLPGLLQALPTTLWIMFVTVLIGSLLGGLLAWARVYIYPSVYTAYCLALLGLLWHSRVFKMVVGTRYQ